MATTLIDALPPSGDDVSRFADPLAHGRVMRVPFKADIDARRVPQLREPRIEIYVNAQGCAPRTPHRRRDSGQIDKQITALSLPDHAVIIQSDGLGPAANS